MSTEPLNTVSIQQFIQQVKSADAGNQRDIRLDIATAKNLAFTLGIVMSRLEGDLEKLVTSSKSSSNDEVITIKMDPGGGWVTSK
jgi:hypothetical protein